MSSSDLRAFNEQLSRLAEARLPLEYGLQLIAEDLKFDRLSKPIARLSAELERGVPLAEAFARQPDQFPALYARLIDAGVRSNNLSGMLLNLGRHLEMLQRLRAAMWRTLTYPMVVLLFFAIVMAFIGHFLLPQFRMLFSGMPAGQSWRWFWSYDHPMHEANYGLATFVLERMCDVVPITIALGAVLVIGLSLLIHRRGQTSVRLERIALRTPLIGPILRSSLVARWCDATSLAVSSGMDLPGAMRLADDVVHSPSLHGDVDRLAMTLEAGGPIEAADRKYAVLFATVPFTLSGAGGDLVVSLRSLSDLYEHQARLRIANIPAVVSPILLGALAVLIGLAVVALTLPIVQFWDSLMRS